MIRITVELVSAVSAERNQLLGVAVIANDGTGTATVGNYTCSLSRRGRDVGKVLRSGRIEGFPRKRLGGWDLLYRVLRSAVGERNA